MMWLWIGLVLGVIAPRIVVPDTIRIAYEEFGVVGGAGVWMIACLLSVPLMIGACWIGQAVF